VNIYNTQRWKTTRNLKLRLAHFRCQSCGRSVAGPGNSRVDHIKPVKEAPELAFDPTNLRVLCPACDNARHSEKGGNQQEKREIGLDGFPDSWR
jgi:5-methylcytosine-specific restriction endonuclease McrA